MNVNDAIVLICYPILRTPIGRMMMIDLVSIVARLDYYNIRYLRFEKSKK